MKAKNSKFEVKRITILLAILSLSALALIIGFSQPAKKAYAASWDVVPVEEVFISTENSLNIQPEQTVELKASTFPEYALHTASQVTYEFLSGSYFAALEGSNLTVNKDAEIGASIVVRAVVDYIPSNNTLVFTIVKTPILSVSILNTETQIKENEALKMNVRIEPQAASFKDVIYTITEGVQYASVGMDGIIRVRNHLPAGNLFIKVKATSANDTTKYDEKVFNLYVPAKTLELSASNLLPVPNEEITLISQPSVTASPSIVDYEIIEGEEFVESINGNKLKLSAHIDSFDPKIRIKCARDGIESNEMVVNIYVPVTSLITAPAKLIMKQGEMQQIDAVIEPLNGSRVNLQYYIVGGDDNQYASISNSGILTAKTNAEVATASVFVYSEIDGVRSASVEILIEKPSVILSANNYNPTTKSTQADSVNLTVTKDGIAQPYDALNFNVIAGQEYISSLTGGVLQIKTSITDQDPQIRLTAFCGDYESGEIIIKIRVLAETIAISNDEIIEVEQQRSYIFAGQVLPVNAANAAQKLVYAKNVGDDIATLTQTGELTVRRNAPIGSVITITVTGPDGVVSYHTVTVKKVYATEIRLDSVTNQNGVQIFKEDNVFANDVLSFDVAFPSPFNVTDALKDYSVMLYSGDTDCASIDSDGKTIIIKPQSQITKFSPTFTVKIFSSANPAVQPIYRTFTIYLAVESVNTSQLKLTVEPNTSYNITDIISAQILPFNSNVRHVTYAIDGDCDYAMIINNSILQISDKNKLPSGNCGFTIIASAEGFSSAQTYSVYVKAESITYVVKNLSDGNYNYAPMSTKTMGQQMRIEFAVDSMATTRVPNINVKTGENLMRNRNYIDGVLTFDIVANASGKLIQLEACLDDLVVAINDIVIYKPIQEITATTQKFVNGKYYISRDDYSKNVILGSAFGENWSAASSRGEVDLTNRSMPVLKIPVKTKADTAITVTISTNDPRCQYSQSFTYYVEELSASIFVYSVNGNLVSFPYDLDSEGVRISRSKPQLWVGRYTDVNITTANGLGLSYYGLTAAGTRISIPSDASGKSSVTPEITIADGTKQYILTLPEIYVFRPMSGSPGIVGGSTAMSQKSKSIKLTAGSGWDAYATYGLEDLVIKASGLSGARFAGGTLYIESSNASAVQTLLVECLQEYNGEKIAYLNSNGSNYTVTQAVKRITLIKNGGSNGSGDVIGINDLGSKISSLPAKPNYAFKGFYSSSSGGTQYYDKAGSLVSGRSLSVPTTLYAQWVLVYNTVTFHEDGDVQTITDDDTRWDNYQNIGLNLPELRAMGYTKLTFNISVKMQEINDGYQELYLWSGKGYNIWENKDIEFSSKNWGTVNYSVTINISDLSDGSSYWNSIRLGYRAHGKYDDDWNRGYSKVSISAA